MKKIHTKLALPLAFAGLLVFGCHKDNDPGNTGKSHVIYLETNDAGGNAVLAYTQQPDSSLSPLAGSPYSTGGKGLSNPGQGLGPDDADNELAVTPDGKFLLAVNAGSMNIAVFSIAANGNLAPVSGSPFNSRGPNPESIAIKDKFVYVVNKGTNDPDASGNEPNYTVMTIDENGALKPLDNATFKTTSGSSPSQALLSNDHHFLFGADFLGFTLMPPQGTLRSFSIGSDNRLTPVAGTPITIPGMGGALGLWQHPLANILYVGFPLQAKVAVYNIDAVSGALTLNKTVDGGLAACWLRTSKDGKYLYALNSGENTLSFFNTADPASPKSIGKLTLKKPGPLYMAMGLTFTTSEDFSFEFSKDGKFCYVISQHTNMDFTIGNYNFLHVLTVQPDGTLQEPKEPLSLPVSSHVRPQGVVTIEAIK